MTDYQGNANQNLNDIPSYLFRMNIIKKTKTNKCKVKDVE